MFEWFCLKRKTNCTIWSLTKDLLVEQSWKLKFLFVSICYRTERRSGPSSATFPQSVQMSNSKAIKKTQQHRLNKQLLPVNKAEMAKNESRFKLTWAVTCWVSEFKKHDILEVLDRDYTATEIVVKVIQQTLCCSLNLPFYTKGSWNEHLRFYRSISFWLNVLNNPHLNALRLFLFLDNSASEWKHKKGYEIKIKNSFYLF